MATSTSPCTAWGLSTHSRAHTSVSTFGRRGKSQKSRRQQEVRCFQKHLLLSFSTVRAYDVCVHLCSSVCTHV